MKLPLASKYILSEIDDYFYLCCFCNSFTTTIKYLMEDTEYFYDNYCSNCQHLDDGCDGGVSALEYGDCYKYCLSNFQQELFIKVNVPNHVYIEKYEYSEFIKAKLLVLHDNNFKPLILANIHNDGEICFGDAIANTPASRYSRFWSSEFNDDLTNDELIEDRNALKGYLSNWNIEKQEAIYEEYSFDMKNFINENNYIENNTATDIIFFKDLIKNSYFVGLGTNNNNHLNIQYLK